MNLNFKDEFSKLNLNDICDMINKFADEKILKDNSPAGYWDPFKRDKYQIKFIKDRSYGHYKVSWYWEQTYYGNMENGGRFKYSINIYPMHVDFKNVPYEKNFINKDKKLEFEKTIKRYIAKHCPHYKQALLEEIEDIYNNKDILSM